MDTTHSQERSLSTGRVVMEYLPSGIPLLRLGHSSERVVTITAERIQSFREAIGQLRAERPKALVISGPSLDMFTAGADLNLIKNVSDPALGERLAREGQLAFDELQALPFPTIAAISGACVGGGCELVLGCTYRIISDHRSSLIGLPEIKLGILPGFGGTQRLPRLIGLPKALDIILGGKTLRPKQALKCGLVNEIVSTEKLMDRASVIASGEAKPRAIKIPVIDRLLTFTSLGRSFVKKNASKSVQKETKGFYPAPPAALESALVGLERGFETGLRFEAKELGRLIVSPESKALVKLYFLTEASKAIGKGARKSVEQLHAIVVGAGVMGAGIAGVFAKSDCQVILKDSSEAALGKGLSQIKKYLEGLKYLTTQEKSFVLNRIEVTSTTSSNTGNANFAIEAILEEIDIKKKVLADLASQMPQDAIIATNTSSLSVTEIARAIPNPERVVGMHFFNPVPKMPLVEIIRADQSSDKTVAVVAALASKLGKYPIVVKDVPGFLVNRILAPYLNEAVYLLQDQAATEIDRSALKFGMPMGPIRLLDEVGLDVVAHVQEVMFKGYGERMRGPDYASRLAKLGRMGKKSGSGFYNFHEGEAVPCTELRELLGLKPVTESSDSAHICERLMLSLVNEAVRCLDEGVAGKPSPEAASQIDLGTVMGMGFPPFRGGIFGYADSLGAKKILEDLTRLEAKHGARFSPAPGIAARASKNISFYEV